MKSTLKLYYSTNELKFKLDSSKLFVVESFEQYLAQFTPVILTNFQYNTITSMEGSVKIIANQDNIALLKAYRYKYCSIQNDGEEFPRYYFITDITWRSQSSVALSLMLDVLNTYRVGRDYSFNAKTNILREHRNRFEVGEQTRTFVSLSYAVLMMRWHNDWIYFLENVVENPVDTIIFTKPADSQMESYDLWLLDRDELQVHEHYNFDKIIFIEDSSDIEFYLNDELVFTGRSGEQYGSGYIMAIRSEYMDAQIGEDVGLLIYKQKIASMSSGTIKVTNDIHRIIDKNNEDINPILYKMDNDIEVVDGNSVGTKWNLVYRNANNPTPDDLANPVECYLVPEERKEIKYGTTLTGRINPLDLEEGVYYYVNEWELGFDIHNSFTNSDGNQIADSDGDKGFVFWRIDENTIGYRITFYGTWNELYEVVFDVIHQTSYIDVSQPTFRYGKNPDTLISLLKTYPYNYHQNVPVEWYSGYSWEWSTGVLTTTLNAMGEWDKTDAKLIKIIKLPYIPADIPLDEGLLVPTQTFAVTTINGLVAIKLQDLNYKWLNHIDSDQISPIKEVLDCGDTIFQTKDYESKMYNSEFFIKKYVYDSFALPIIMENVDYGKYASENPNGVLNVNFYATSTINSRFAFEVVDYVCTHGDGDYYRWLIIARNNEATLYNVAYINYIRTGFNYDVKNKDVSNAMSWATFGAGLVGTIGSIIGAVYSGGIAIPMAVGLGTTTAMSLMNAINTTNKNERDLAQKQDQLKQQSANVRGSDDFDLMYRYNGNQLLIMEYKPSDAMVSLLNRLFYYTGYRTNIYGVPVTNTRKDFNYLMCNPVFNIFNKNINKELEAQLYLLFKTGVTYIHHTILGWDMEQEQENLEMNMYEYELGNII